MGISLHQSVHICPFYFLLKQTFFHVPSVYTSPIYYNCAVVLVSFVHERWGVNERAHVQKNTHDLHKECRDAVLMSLSFCACQLTHDISSCGYFRWVHCPTGFEQVDVCCWSAGRLVSDGGWPSFISLDWSALRELEDGCTFFCVFGWNQSITVCAAGAQLTLKLSTLSESLYRLNDLHTLWCLFVWIRIAEMELRLCLARACLFILWPAHSQTCPIAYFS